MRNYYLVIVKHGNEESYDIDFISLPRKYEKYHVMETINIFKDYYDKQNMVYVEYAYLGNFFSYLLRRNTIERTYRALNLALLRGSKRSVLAEYDYHRAFTKRKIIKIN